MGPAYLLFLVSFTCTHKSSTEGEPGTGYFWKKSNAETTHYLYVDNENKGVLPFLPEALTSPGSETIQKQGLSFILKPGSYDIIAKDSSGNIFCEGTLFLKRTAGSKEVRSSWKNGSCAVEMVYND